MSTPTVTAKANNAAYDVSANQWNAVVNAAKNQPYSYIIYTDGSTYYAKNSETGQIEYSSADAYTLTQNVVTALAGSGEIHYKSGTYDFGASSVVVSASGLTVTGEGKSTHIIGNNHGYGAFKFIGSPGAIYDFKVADIYFTGDKTDAESHGIYFINCTRFTVENCFFEDFGDEAIILNPSSRYGVIRNNWFNITSTAGAGQGTAIDLQSGCHLIDGNVIVTTASDATGIHLEAIAGTEAINSVIIVNNYINGNDLMDIGIYLHADAFTVNDIVVSNNEIYNTTTGGIIDGVTGSEKVSNVIITGNLVSGGGAAAAARGAIKINKNTPLNAVISGNIVKDWDGTANCIGIQVHSANASVINNRVANVGGTGINMQNLCVGSTVMGNVISGYSAGGLKAGIVAEATYMSIIGNTFSSGTNAIRIRDVGDYISITGNVFVSGGGSILNDISATHLEINQNQGYVTESSGTATVANGQTDTGNITHGLSYTPDAADITVTPTNNLGNATKYYVGGISATVFVIYVDADPGAGTATFSYAIRRR